jgi:hypothetical protein
LIIFGGAFAHESSDRQSLTVEDPLIENYIEDAKFFGKQVVMNLNLPGPSVIKSKRLVDALLVNFYEGERVT